MEATTTWVTELATTLGEQLSLAVQYLPGLVGAFLVLILGWLLARIVRRATKGFAHTFNRLLSKMFPTGLLSEAQLSPRMTAIVGQLLFWIILLITITVAARVAGLDAVSQWLDRVTAHVPNLLVAFAIIVVGYVLSLLVREQFDTQVQQSVKSDVRPSIGKLAQSSIVVVALVLALDQLGVDVTLLIAMTVVGAFAVAIVFGVSIALGVRIYMTNIVGIRTARSQLHAGQRIRIGNVEGLLLEITPTQLALETEDGKTLVPGRFVDQRVITVIAPDQDGSLDND